MKPPLVVLKFGTPVLSGSSRLPAVVHEIYRCYRQGSKVVAVVSAIGRHTDLLLDQAKRISAPTAPDALAADDFLAAAREEENRLIINGAEGRCWQVSGKGAGRWPTAEAVIADMLEIHAVSVRAKAPLPIDEVATVSFAERLPPLKLTAKPVHGEMVITQPEAAKNEHKAHVDV
jgi:homoserine dehydrogenase-like protein/amino acid kinase family protein